jgi:hypothetical protein
MPLALALLVLRGRGGVGRVGGASRRARVVARLHRRVYDRGEQAHHEDRQ